MVDRNEIEEDVAEAVLDVLRAWGNDTFDPDSLERRGNEIFAKNYHEPAEKYIIEVSLD